MKFYLMWANHDVNGTTGMSTGTGKMHPRSGKERWSENFNIVVDRVIRQYFNQPNYFRIDGEPGLLHFQFQGSV